MVPPVAEEAGRLEIPSVLVVADVLPEEPPARPSLVLPLVPRSRARLAPPLDDRPPVRQLIRPRPLLRVAGGATPPPFTPGPTVPPTAVAPPA